jgi:hypothetical protein
VGGEEGEAFVALAEIGDVCCSLEFVDDHLEDFVGELGQICAVVFVVLGSVRCPMS